MREVSIHLKDIFIPLLQSPLKACDVGCAQSQFSSTFQDEKTVRELPLHQSFYDGCCAVGRTIINHENVKTFFQCKHCTNNLLNVLLLVVGRYDNNTVAFVHLPIVIYLCFLLFFYVAKLAYSPRSPK